MKNLLLVAIFMFTAGCLGGANIHTAEYRTSEAMEGGGVKTAEGCMAKLTVDSKAFSMDDLSDIADGCLSDTAPVPSRM